MMDRSVAHFYKLNRAHQRASAAKGGSMLTIFESGRTELSFGGAPYGEHALSAFMAAKRELAFRDRARKAKK